MSFSTLFNALFTLLKTSAVIIYLNEYFKNNYPETHQQTLITISYNLIYCYSKGQLIFIKSRNCINKFIQANPYYKKIVDEIYKKKVQQNEIFQIKNDQIYIKYFTDINDIQFEHEKDCFYIFSDNINAVNKCVNKIILQSQPFLTNYELSNIKFMLVEVKIGDKTFKIDLKTDNENFYIINNILDKRFFTYYLKNYQHYNFKDEDFNDINLDKLSLKIIDNNVNVRELEITDDKFIIIKKDEYIY
jgi:hypothetical protein